MREVTLLASSEHRVRIFAKTRSTFVDARDSLLEVDQGRIAPHAELFGHRVIATLDEFDPVPLRVVVDVLELLERFSAFFTVHLILI